MSTVTEELLLRIAVIGGAVGAAEVGAFEDRIASTGRTVERTSKHINVFRGLLQSFGAIGVGAAIYESVKSFAQFQQRMEMLHTQTGATQTEVTNATKAVMNMAVAVGTGPNSLAQALYHIESTQKRGVGAYNELRIAAEGAKVGQADLVDVTNALNAVLVGKLIPATGGFKAAMGQLNATVGSGDMYMQDLASAYSTGILASMKRVGLQLIDVNAAMATLGDNNIRGTQAANRLRMGLLQVVKPTAEAAKELHKLRMGTYDLANDYYKPHGLFVMLEDLHKHMDKLGHNEQNSVLMSLFGRGRMSAGIMTLYDQMDRLGSKYKAIADGAKNFDEAWKRTRQTFGFFIDQIKTFAEVEMVRLGNGIRHVVGWIKDLVTGFEHGKTWAYAITAGIIALALAFGGLELAVAAFGAVMVLIENIPLIAFIAAIAFGIMMLIRHWKAVKEAATDALHWIVTAANDAWNWIKAHWPLLAEILLAPFMLLLAPIAGLFGTTVPRMIRGFVSFVTGVFHGKGGILSVLEWPFTQLWHILRTLWNAMVSDVRWFVRMVEKAIGAILGPLKDVWHYTSNLGSGILHSAEHLLGFADGGTVQSGGPYWVGERGPELVYLPQGAYVQPNHQLGTPAGGGTPLEATIVLENYLDGKAVSRQMVRQGLMATARRGAGGPTMSDVG